MCGGDINNLFGRLPSYRSVVEATEAYIQEMARQGEAQSKLRLRNEAERSARIAKHRFEQFLQPILPSINAAFKKEQFLRAVSVEVNQIAQEGVVGGVSSFDSWLAEKEARFSARIDAIQARFSAQSDAIQARFSAQSDALEAAIMKTLEKGQTSAAERGETEMPAQLDEILNDLKVHYTDDQSGFDEVAKFLRQVESFAAIGSELSNLRASTNVLKASMAETRTRIAGTQESIDDLRRGMAASSAGVSENIVELEASSAELEASMAGTDERVDELRASMEADTAGAAQNIVELEASTAELEASTAELEASMAGTEERVDELRASMGAGTAEVAQNIVELEARMAGTEERGDELRASMGAGTAEVAQNIVELEARMAGTQDSVDELRRSMAGTREMLDELRMSMGAGTAEVAQNIVELEARMAGTKERVDELRASMRAGTAESKAWTAEVAQNIVELEARTAESKARTAELEASTAEVVQNIVESKARTAELEARTAERQEALRIQYEEMSRAVQKAIREMNELSRKADAALGDSFAGENFEYTQPIMFSAARPLLMSSLRTEGGLQGPGEVREMTTDEPVRKWSYVSPQSPVTDSLAERGGDGNAVVIKPSHENVFMYCIQKIHELFSQILHFFCSSIPRVIYQNVSLLEIEQEVG